MKTQAFINEWKNAKNRTKNGSKIFTTENTNHIQSASDLMPK